MKKHYYTPNIRNSNTIIIKIFMILLIFICGCETTQTTSTLENNINRQPKMVRNPKCEDIKSFKVFQVHVNFVLANVCRERDDQ